MTKDERIAELEMQIKELEDDNRNLRKGLNKEGLDYFITQTNNIRHEICEKIRNKAFATEAFYDDKSEIVQYTIYTDELDKIERGEE